LEEDFFSAGATCHESGSGSSEGVLKPTYKDLLLHN
jgi:hypothetical protein